MKKRKLLRRAARLLAPTSSLALPRPRQEDYYADPDRGLGGSMAPQDRLSGIDALIPLVRDRSVLDLGCAEGLILQRLLQGEPRSGHGVDHSPRRIDSARRLCTDPRLRFDVVELNRPESLDAAPLAERYDVVLCLGVYQHLLPATRAATLRRALAKCGELFVYRSPRAHAAEALPIIETAGFEREQLLREPNLEALVIHRRKA